MRDVAEIVARLSGAEVQRVANPRQEDAENELVVANSKFKLLGLDPVRTARIPKLPVPLCLPVAITLRVFHSDSPRLCCGSDDGSHHHRRALR